MLISHTGETEPCKCLASVIEKMPQQNVIQVCLYLHTGVDQILLFLESPSALFEVVISFQASQGILDSSQSEAGEGRLVAALSR